MFLQKVNHIAKNTLPLKTWNKISAITEDTNIGISILYILFCLVSVAFSSKKIDLWSIWLYAMFPIHLVSLMIISYVGHLNFVALSNVVTKFSEATIKEIENEAREIEKD